MLCVVHGGRLALDLLERSQCYLVLRTHNLLKLGDVARYVDGEYDGAYASTDEAFPRLIWR